MGQQRHLPVEIEVTGGKLTEHLDHDGDLDRRGGRHLDALIDPGRQPRRDVLDRDGHMARSAHRNSGKLVLKRGQRLRDARGGRTCSGEDQDERSDGGQRSAGHPHVCIVVGTPKKSMAERQ